MTARASHRSPAESAAHSNSDGATHSIMIYVDGAARGNPGPAGLGVVIYDQQGQVIRQLYKYIGETTNNVAEYLALVYALQEALILRAQDVTVCTDSELLSKQLDGTYKVRDEQLRFWYDQIVHLRSGFRSLTVQAVGRERNTAADRLANHAVDQRFDTAVKYHSLG